MKLFVTVAHLLWPSMVLAGLWLVVGLVALWYARSTRRPVFTLSAIGAFFMLVGQILSPARLAYHYLKGIPIPGGQAGRIELLVGAYKYQIAIEAIGALFFLAGLVREVMFARRRARLNAARAAQTAGTNAPAVNSDGQGSEAALAATSPASRRAESAGFPANQVTQAPAAVSPLAPYDVTAMEPYPPSPAAHSEQPCPRCRALLSPDAQFCGNCGMQLPSTGPQSFSVEPPGYPQGRTSARSAGARSNEDFL